MKDLRYSWIPHKLFYKLFCTVKDVLFLSVKSQSNHSGEKKKANQTLIPLLCFLLTYSLLNYEENHGHILKCTEI